jgi:hypothetical protein
VLPSAFDEVDVDTDVVDVVVVLHLSSVEAPTLQRFAPEHCVAPHMQVAKF